MISEGSCDTEEIMCIYIYKLFKYINYIKIISQKSGYRNL